ncbi:MAG TPA: sensor histidine kinase [Clostridiales bacterium]|nr:sensor histidine kinase [Clostridiales bacterium]
MINNINLDISRINTIIKRIIEGISSSREEVLKIVDSIRNEQENVKLELCKIKNDLINVVDEVDALEKQDKYARQWLAEVSKNFNIYNENDIKNAYEKALDLRVKLITKENEEKVLKDKRNNLEMTLKRLVENIDSSEKIINQISIALAYLEGDILSAFDDADKNSEMFIGIKILEAQENERKRIARDIHDGPAQHMANVAMQADICKMAIHNDLQEGLKELEALKASVKEALKEVRSIIFNLRPMSLDDLGLNQTIQETVKTISQESNINIQLKLKPIQGEIEPIIQVAVYRIIQEVFNNIKKHSGAKHVTVKLDFGTKYLILAISDDGIGFNVEETLKRVKTRGTCYGLIGILDRVNQLQGEIRINSSEGNGTVYTVKLPVNREVIKDE